MKKRTVRKTRELFNKIVYDKIFLATSAVVMVFIWGLVVFNVFFASSKNVLAEVGREKIYRQDLNEQIYGRLFEGSVLKPSNISKEEKENLLNQLIEWKIVELEAKKRGISASEEEIEERIVKDLESWTEYTDEQKSITRKTTRNFILKEKVKEKVLGWREGEYILLHIDRHLESELGTSKEQKELEDQGREERIKEEKDYAFKLANSLYEQIISGKIKFEDAIEVANEDQKVGADSFAPRNVLRGGEFTREEWEVGSLITGFSDFRQKALEIKVGDISQPFMIQLNLMDDSKKDGLVAIIKNKKGEDGKYSTFNEWLSSKKEEIKIKKYILGNFIKATYAHNTGNYNEGEWGIHSGSEAATAGLIVKTQVKYLNNNYSRLNRIDVKIQAKNGSGSAFYYKYDETNGTSKTFKTGSEIYSGPSDSNNHVHANGYFVLGYGDSNSHGNRYSLDCDWEFDASPQTSAAQVISSLGLSNATYSGYWDPLEYNLSISNGSNYWRTFTFVITKKVNQPQDPTLTVRAEGTNGSNLSVLISANPVNFSGNTTYTKTGSSDQQVILTAPSNVISGGKNYTFSTWVLSNAPNLGTNGTKVTLKLPSGNSNATAKAVYIYNNPASGNCNISLNPSKGVVPLKTQISVSYSPLPPDGYDHSHCIAWDQYGNCTSWQYINYYWKREDYKLYYQEYNQNNMPVGPEIMIAQGSGTPPTTYDYTFSEPLDLTKYYVIKFWHKLRKYTDDGHFPSTSPTVIEYECGNNAVSSVFPRKWGDMDWWEVAP